MGTHPIFESDFDCLTANCLMSDPAERLMDSDGMPNVPRIILGDSRLEIGRGGLHRARPMTPPPMARPRRRTGSILTQTGRTRQPLSPWSACQPVAKRTFQRDCVAT